MATIVERPRNSKPSAWQATIRVKGQATVTKTFEHRDLAERFAQSVELKLQEAAQKELGKRARMQPKQASLEALLDKSLADILKAFRDSGDSTERHRRNLPTVIKSVGNVTLRNITSSWNKTYVSRMRSDTKENGPSLAYSTISGHLQIMATACEWWADSLDIPAPSLNFSKKHFPRNWENKRTRRLSAKEQALLEQAIERQTAPSKKQWLLLMKLALETAARLQELVLAQWVEFDLDTKTWTIPAINTKGKKQRSVPLSPAALQIMADLQDDAAANNSRVFHQLGTPGSVSTGFAKFVRAAGLVDFRFHDLRHEAVSRLVLHQRALLVFEIMLFVGHKELSTFMGYANLRADEMAARMV